MNISFSLLTGRHFSLLLKWLQTPHVRRYWDSHVNWNKQLISSKYSSYIQNYKTVRNQKKSIWAYIIIIDNIEVGYIQYYNAYDFPRSFKLENLPESLAAVDFYIGEEDIIGKGLGVLILDKFLRNIVANHFHYCLVDPDKTNKAAIKTYIKVGFNEHEVRKEEIIMLKQIQVGL